MRFFGIAVRFLMALALALWVGGFAFFGAVSAPVMFKMAREQGVPAIAPQMVGGMLTRFAYVCAVCTVILIAGWICDGFLRRFSRLWQVQGVLLIIALSLGTYLNFGLLPQTISQQREVLPIFTKTAKNLPLSPAETATQARFDAGHHAFNRLASIDLWLLVGVLLLVIASAGEGEVKGRREAVL